MSSAEIFTQDAKHWIIIKSEHTVICTVINNLFLLTLMFSVCSWFQLVTQQYPKKKKITS